MNVVIRLLKNETRGAQTVTESLLPVIRYCETLLEKNEHYVLNEKEVYAAWYSVSRVLNEPVNIDMVYPSVLELWQMLRQYQGKPAPDLDTLFPIEFATNMMKRGGRVHLVSSKYLCLPYPRDESIVNGWSSSSLVADEGLLDFVWNVMYLKLKRPEDIKAFVCQRGDGYLLTPEQSATLVTQGKHEVYQESELSDTREAVKEITTILDGMVSMTQNPFDITFDLNDDLDELMTGI